MGCVSGIYRHGGLVPVFVWAVIWCSFRWKPAAYAAEKQCRNCLRKIEAKHERRMYVYIVASRIPYGMRGLKWKLVDSGLIRMVSHPIRDAWIEIRHRPLGLPGPRASHPIRDAWIEIR